MSLLRKKVRSAMGSVDSRVVPAQMPQGRAAETHAMLTLVLGFQSMPSMGQGPG